MGKIIGIDLGTTNSAVCYLKDGKAIAIANSEGDRTTPSIVAFTKKGEWVVGKLAKNQAITNAKQTFYAIKRLIGRKFNDAEVQKTIAQAPFKIIEHTNGDAWVQIGEGDKAQKFAPQQISAEILKKMKKTAEDYLGEEVTEAIITVPAYFNDSQRQATKEAGMLAGLEVKRIINEPTAAALSYGVNKTDKKDQKVIVYDLGGGTFDVSVLELSSDGLFEVKATNGNTFLGGEDFDARIMKHLIETFKADTENNPDGLDISASQMSLQQLKKAAEEAKITLSNAMTAEVNVPFIASGPSGPANLMVTLTRAKLESLVSDLIEATREPCVKALKDAGLAMTDIDEVILVGGMTRMPKVIETVRQIFGKEPNRGVNPDEVVAEGAALQGGVITGEVKDVLLMDVIPLSIGIETKGGVFTKMIERNSSIPAKTSMTFSTARDNQTSVSVGIFQGEREMAKDNVRLGIFDLGGIPPAPMGVPQIEVTLDIDANGILNVSAKELVTKKESKITIKANSGLTEAEIERMLKDAEANAEQDRARKEAVEVHNNADAALDMIKKEANEDYIKQAPAELTTVFNDAVEALKVAMKANDTAVMKEKLELLDKTRSAMGKAFFEAHQAANGTPAEGASTDGAKPTGTGAGHNTPKP